MAETTKKGWPAVDEGRLLGALERATVIGVVVYTLTQIIRPGIAAILGF